MDEQKTKVIIGVDEAGRGSFFGPICSGVVVFDDNLIQNAVEKEKLVIRDSKKMTPLQRNRCYDYLVNNAKYGVGLCSVKEIDELGISRCNVLCMHRAIEDLLSKFTNQLEIELVRVDGVLFKPFRDTPFELVVQGESKHPEIAMASIIAKTYRDRMMIELCKDNNSLQDRYDLENNKGYGTAKHIAGLRKYGPHPQHRKLFIRNHNQHLQFLK